MFYLSHTGNRSGGRSRGLDFAVIGGNVVALQLDLSGVVWWELYSRILSAMSSFSARSNHVVHYLRYLKRLCPGSNLYELLPLIRFITEEDDNAMDRATWKFVQGSLQALEPPLYAGKAIDGRPGRNTNTALRAFENRMQLEARGVIEALGDPNAAIWPATRELLFVVSAHAASGP